MNSTNTNTSTIVKNYLIQDLNNEEKQSYLEYANGNINSTEWIEKTLKRRDTLLTLDLKCTKYTNNIRCDSWVSIEETGKCKCSNGHTCYNLVINAINNLKIPT
jgi:hypothetical protein